MKIKIFTVGGTIDKVYFDSKSNYEVGDPQADGVLKRANVTVQYNVESLMRKDSLDMTDQDRQRIYDAVAAETTVMIVITHGTDTMVETAKVLSGIAGKTIVMTGSMYPADFRDSDAVFNIGSAFAAVQSLPPGVYIAMNGRILDPVCTRKNREQNRFEDIDAGD